ncbi:MAG: hypothetical protein ABIK65_00250 [Candidatus Eisenbacteria bacterium]
MAGKKRLGRIGWLILALFLAAWAVDLHRDIRDRDGFSWMDPAQYHDFASVLREGGAPAGGFSVASAFPYLVVPFLAVKDTPAAALHVNLFAALVLAASLVLLVRSFGLRTTPAFPLVLVLGAPLLLGLSRELYTEFTLTAAVALAFAVWFRTDRFRRAPFALLFGALFAAGLLIKMTFALFFLGPVLFEGVSALRAREGRRLALLAAATLLPAAAVVLGIRFAAPESFRYYLSLGNTRIPIMRLLGPPDRLSLDSLLYYAVQTGRTGLWFLAFLLVVPFALRRRVGGRKTGPLRDRFIVLWLWWLVPCLVLTMQVVKEPRHMAPCLVPALLLVTAGIERIRGRRLRPALAAAAVAVALAQYLAVTRDLVDLPYRMTGPLEAKRIELSMVAADAERDRHRTSPGGSIDIYRWRFTKSIALAGFGPNEALGLTWYFAPAVSYDLDLPQWERGRERAYERFEDLFYFPAINAYNRRATWPRAYGTLDRDVVTDLADYMLVRGPAGALAARLYPQHQEIGRFRNGSVRLLARRSASPESYRERYAREFLRRAIPPDPVERNTIYFSLFMVERLRGRIPDRERLLAGFPEGFAPGWERRNIFWIAHDFPLRTLAEGAYRDHLAGRL